MPVIVTGVPLGSEAPGGGPVIVVVGGAAAQGRLGGRDQTSLEGSRLSPHVGEQIHRRLLHVGIGIGQVVGVIAIVLQGPRTTGPCRH